MSRRFIDQYPLSPPINEISNLYKKIRIQQQIQFFYEIMKKVKFKRPVPQPKKNKLPISVSSKTIQSQVSDLFLFVHQEYQNYPRNK
ncbi:unnamed protein product (macronuclear) [Paramecium tetraurelia]|uniref:Uncharacterized protein n=1 Tax=Paramecium tetraurelia TaxID=5888 RepID=A0CU94_PARTE|nr:uncharacterized protein GSPATT00010560001 [Paramecium tetraurelia]CAK74361.1 unnamed protein product [Paramecium tetraurelia]|eukprot:XP_001441758.1 hypothetical protein (macronuclear) [Paramecium tetraurelia strain d4-2]